MNTNTNNFPRKLKSQIDIAMQDTPVVLVNGPRQSGKTTSVMFNMIRGILVCSGWGTSNVKVWCV